MRRRLLLRSEGWGPQLSPLLRQARAGGSLEEVPQQLALPRPQVRLQRQVAAGEGSAVRADSGALQVQVPGCSPLKMASEVAGSGQQPSKTPFKGAGCQVAGLQPSKDGLQGCRFRAAALASVSAPALCISYCPAHTSPSLDGELARQCGTVLVAADEVQL